MKHVLPTVVNPNTKSINAYEIRFGTQSINLTDLEYITLDNGIRDGSVSGHSSEAIYINTKTGANNLGFDAQKLTGQTISTLTITQLNCTSIHTNNMTATYVNASNINQTLQDLQDQIDALKKKKVGDIYHRVSTDSQYTEGAHVHLKCDGQTFDQLQYPDLYTLLGTNVTPIVTHGYIVAI